MTSRGETSDPVGAAKQALRRRLLDARRALDPGQIAAARVDVAHHVLAGLGAVDRIVAAYDPLRTEPGSVELLSLLVASGREVLVPITLADRDLSWTSWVPGAGETGADCARPDCARPDRARPDRGTGVHAPADLGREAIERADVVLVPALAVGPGGARLGRGGGSYDRALARTHGRIVALLHRGELLPEVPVGPHDVPVNAVVTPDGWVELG